MSWTGSTRWILTWAYVVRFSVAQDGFGPSLDFFSFFLLGNGKGTLGRMNVIGTIASRFRWSGDMALR